jgi:hypothetical protein
VCANNINGGSGGSLAGGVIRRINRRTDYVMNNRKRTNKDPQNIIQKTEDRETRTIKLNSSSVLFSALISLLFPF